MSGAVDTLDMIDMMDNLLLTLRLDEPGPSHYPTSASNYLKQFNDNYEIDFSKSNDLEPQENKKKKKRSRKKRNKNKKDPEEEQVSNVQQVKVNQGSVHCSPAKPTSSVTNNNKAVLKKICFSIKAVRSQNFGISFHKRNTKCQYVNFEYNTQGNNEAYIFDSRDFVKLEVLNESFVEVDNKTPLKNGIVNKSDLNKTDKVKNLQTSTSQGKAKKRKQKRIVTRSKENDKVVQFIEHYNLEVVEEKLKSGELIKGPIRINPKNHKTAYVGNADRNCQDYLITSTADRNRALEGDVVVLELKPESEWIENQKTAHVIHILEKVHPRTTVGILSVFYHRGRKLAALQPRDRRVPRIVVPQTSLPPLYFKNPTEYEDVLFMAKITEWTNPRFAEGILIERVGIRNHLKSETAAILLENQLDVTPFPPSIEKYLPESSSIPDEEFKYREDLRKECVFTIDPLTARDLDDAVSCKVLPNGNLEVGVHIADVTYYLKEDTELDEIVSKKGTTIYLVDTVYHMLPVEMCVHCSLLPGKDCLAFSVFWEMTEDGEILSHRFAKTVINSCCQLAYEHAQQMIDNRESFVMNNTLDIYNEFTASELCDTVNKLQKISYNLRKKRFDNGALKIDQIKICFQLNPDGEPADFFVYENMEAHRLIEELMLLANITVGRKILEDFPEIAFLRCHEPPNPRLMKELQNTLENVGIHVDVSSSAGVHNSLQSYSTPDYLGSARNAVLNHLFAKPMTRARYTCASLEENLEHYALSVDIYTHFTSPIRRYADIMVHRLLTASIGHSLDPSWDVDYVRQIAANCNKQKYNAKKAGEASSDLFLAHYVEQHQPFIQDAVVIDVREQSFHVMVLSTGSIVRMYLNNLGEGVQYKSEQIGESEKKKLWKISILYSNEKLQIIEIFQIVKVQLKRKGNTSNLEGQLVEIE